VRSAQLLAILIVAALFVKYFWLLIAAIASSYVTYRIVKECRAQRAEKLAAEAAEAQRLQDIRARADRQHQFVCRAAIREASTANTSLHQCDSALLTWNILPQNRFRVEPY
jgi:uncharacterized protein YdaU (DUF1376 family)